VKSFFTSISHEILQKIHKERFRIPKDVRKLLTDLLSLSAPADEPKGIFPGNPLGKLLGNVYLSGLDDFLAKKDLLFTRYIDDIAVFVGAKEQAERILGDIIEYLRQNLRMDVAKNKTGIYHRYFNRFEFLGFSVVGENMGPSEENVKKFEQRVRNLPDEYKRKGLKKFLRRMNSVVYNFGHMYKMGNVRKLYSKLDEVVRASIRRYLKLSGKGELVNPLYSLPLKFPCNLAFSKEILGRGGFISLVQIKEKFEGKDQKRELKTAGETSAKDFIQNGKSVNAEKIQIRVGDKVIISTTGNVGIGTTGPIAQLHVSSAVVVGSPTGGNKGAGTINAQAVYDDNALLTDYVFDKRFDGEVKPEDHQAHGDYQMESLDEMIDFIEQERHLPTMIGREEWKRKGRASLGQLVNQLWETVETQALYIKQLKETQDQQQKKISALERTIAQR